MKKKKKTPLIYLRPPSSTFIASEYAFSCAQGTYYIN